MLIPVGGGPPPPAPPSSPFFQMASSSLKSFDLEKTLSDLEQIVEELENGQLSLEDAMRRFEEGVKLTRICQKTLKEAEQKVEILMKNSNDTVAFDTDEESEK